MLHVRSSGSQGLLILQWQYDKDAAIDDLSSRGLHSCPRRGPLPSQPQFSLLRRPPQETICQLTCKRDSDCKQNEGDSNKCDKMGVDVSSEAHADMFATRCKQICEESRDAEGAENVCRFYKVSVSRKSGSSLLHHV